MHFRPSVLLVASTTICVAAAASSASASSSSAASAPTCKTQARSNPIAAQYPGIPTGVLNGTVALLPLDLSVARKSIPAEYPILIHAVQELLPWWPGNKYPMLLQHHVDNDIKMGADGNFTLGFMRSSLSFPFVDRLNDGYTSMMYGNNVLLSDVALAIQGTEAYGFTVAVGTFDPECDGFKSAGAGERVLSAVAKDGQKISAKFSKFKASPIPLSFWKNVTNQPQFSGADNCDDYHRLFDTSLSDQNANVLGGAKEVGQLEKGKETEWIGVWGLQGAWAFYEHNYLDCETLKGY